MYRTYIFTLLLGSLMGSLWAQDWSERSKQMEARVEQRMQAQQERIDLAFANQMKRVWIKMSLQQEVPPPSRPAPDIPKVYTPSLTPKGSAEPREVITIEPEVELARREPQAEAAPQAPLEPMSQAVASQIQRLEQEAQAEYFGQRLRFRYDPRMRFTLERRLTEHRVAESWKRLEQTEHELLVYQLTRQAQQLRLNDWGYAQLVAEASRQISPRDRNARVLLQWFLLSKAGYIATVGYNRDHLHLLMPTQQRLYGKTFIRGKEHKLYALDLEGRDLSVREAHIFAHHYPAARRVMDLRVSEAPALSRKLGSRQVKFSYGGQVYQIPIAVNRNLVDFYGSYPFIDLGVYLGAPASEEVRRSMVKHLRHHAQNLEPQQGRSRRAEAVNFLLHFVQALPYQTDHDQFGGERYLFAEETLAFPASDCEDRSVLFAYLVREILHMEVIGLMYPGHAAAAVYFAREKVPGDYVKHRGKTYVVCDPTYIGADIGKALPQAATQMARVVSME